MSDSNQNGAVVIRPYRGVLPTLAASCRIAPGVVVVGDVVVAEEVNLWWGVILRGDDNYIRIGARSNVQDGTIIHVTYQTHPTVVGDDVTIGHGARLHGCTIGDGALIGIGAIVLDGATVEPGGFLAAGAVLTPGKTLPSGELWGGSPARRLRDLNDEDRHFMRWDVEHYLKLAAESLDTWR